LKRDAILNLHYRCLLTSELFQDQKLNLTSRTSGCWTIFSICSFQCHFFL